MFTIDQQQAIQDLHYHETGRREHLFDCLPEFPMPTENRSSNTEMVSVPREWLNSVALLQMPLDQLQEQAVEFLCEPCDEPAEQQQGEPVAWLWEHVNGLRICTTSERAPFTNEHAIPPNCKKTPLYAHANPGEVERLRAENEQLREVIKHSDSNIQRQSLRISNQRTQLAE
ncbi:hypothetical protein PZY26_24855, partial [Pseudomonas guariconensis]